jgi:SAM-dependent methyltransferase
VSGPPDGWRADNRAAWDERVSLHVASDFYDNESFVAGRNSLRPFELDEVGRVVGKTLCHLQCHFGQDTLSWARLGAGVAGLDFSSKAIVAARALAARIGFEDLAEFVVADVYDAVEAFGGRRFDIVYTGLGSLVWHPDIERWAQVCADLLVPGGFLYLAEMHPITDVFDGDLKAVGDYFTHPAGYHSIESGTYVDFDAPTEHNSTWEWTHPISSVLTALLNVGLRIELFHEHDFTLFERWPFLEPRDDFTWRMPADRPRLPLLYSVRASKPASSSVPRSTRAGSASTH